MGPLVTWNGSSTVGGGEGSCGGAGGGGARRSCGWCEAVTELGFGVVRWGRPSPTIEEGRRGSSVGKG
jgi:hypothetical protein